MRPSKIPAGVTIVVRDALPTGVIPAEAGTQYTGQQGAGIDGTMPEQPASIFWRARATARKAAAGRLWIGDLGPRLRGGDVAFAQAVPRGSVAMRAGALARTVMDENERTSACAQSWVGNVWGAYPRLAR